MTEAERRLWQVLRERQLDGFKFRRQQPLGRYIVDFICLSARLIVEVDGGHHGEDLDGERDHWLRAQAFTVLRLWNNDINDNLEGAYAHIEAALKKPFDDQTQSPWAKSKFSSRAGHPHPTPPQPDGPADERSASREPFDRKRAGSPPVRGDGREHEHRRDLHGDAAGGSDETLLDHTPADAPISASRERRNAELRVYGLNAIHAVYARRPEAIRKLYLSENRIQALGPLLRWCVANRVGYRVVDDADLQKLAASSHHEGVVADVLRAEPGPLSQWLRELPAGPQCALWLDGVGNPHNLGAILRSAAHFGVAAVLLPKHSPLTLSGAAARVAEGGAEAVPFVRLGRSDNAIAQLRSVGFALAATVVQGGSDLFATPLPERVVYVLGAESQGMDRELVTMCDLRLSIPGSGAVESLNVAAATAVLLAAWRARR